jgi:hypothetical protein
MLTLFNFSPSLNDPQQRGNKKTEKNHSGKRKIEFEIFSFNADIPRKASYPIKFIMKEIDDNTTNDDDYACEYDVFAGIRVHMTKVKRSRSNVCYSKNTLIV